MPERFLLGREFEEREVNLLSNEELNLAVWHALNRVGGGAESHVENHILRRRPSVAAMTSQPGLNFCASPEMSTPSHSG